MYSFKSANTLRSQAWDGGIAERNLDLSSYQITGIWRFRGLRIWPETVFSILRYMPYSILRYLTIENKVSDHILGFCVFRDPGNVKCL